MEHKNNYSKEKEDLKNVTINLTCACLTCKVKHESQPNIINWLHDVDEFKQKHLRPECKVEYYSKKRNILKKFFNSALDNLYEKIGKAPWWLENSEFAHNSNIKLAYASAVAMTFTSLNSLSSDTNLLAGASSLSADNTSNLYLDVFVSGFVKNNTTNAPTVGKEIDVYLYNSYDDIPTFPNSISGTDSLVTITTSNIQASGLAPFGSAIVAATVSQINAFRGKPISGAFGGIVPKAWGLYITQNTGQAIAPSGNAWNYQGVYMTVI